MVRQALVETVLGARPSWMHFGTGLPHRDAVLALRDRPSADRIELVEEWDEPD